MRGCPACSREGARERGREMRGGHSPCADIGAQASKLGIKFLLTYLLVISLPWHTTIASTLSRIIKFLLRPAKVRRRRRSGRADCRGCRGAGAACCVPDTNSACGEDRPDVCALLDPAVPAAQAAFWSRAGRGSWPATPRSEVGARSSGADASVSQWCRRVCLLHGDCEFIAFTLASEFTAYARIQSRTVLAVVHLAHHESAYQMRGVPRVYLIRSAQSLAPPTCGHGRHVLAAAGRVAPRSCPDTILVGGWRTARLAQFHRS